MLKLTTDKQTNTQDKNDMPPIIRSGGIKTGRDLTQSYEQKTLILQIFGPLPLSREEFEDHKYGSQDQRSRSIIYSV